MATDIPTTMHGVQLVKYDGSPEKSLRYNEEIAVPKIKKQTEVLVRVKAAGINPVEAKAASGNMKLGTFFMSLPCIIGADFSGVIVAKGNQVSDFEIGDEVFGTQTLPFGMDGTYAQYTVVNTKAASIAKKPKDLSFEQVASAGIAAVTAYQGVVNNASITDKNINEKRNIIVVGASGGVGSYGVQIAKAINPDNTVIGICSGKNAKFVKSLGADKVIDYKDREAYEAFISTSEKNSFDLVFDCVGGDEYYKQLDPLLKKKGVYSTAVGPIEHIGSNYVSVFTASSLISKIAYKKLFGSHSYAMITALPHSEFRTKIAPLFESKKVHGTVHDDDNIVPLKDAPKAFEKIWSHRTVGKIVLSID